MKSHKGHENMNTKEFRKLIKEQFAPKLHELGFKGTNQHFIKTTDNHYIYTLVIQADKYGGSCVMEMGVHLDFLPNTIGEFISTNKITTYDCEFRKRISNKINWLSRFFTGEHERWFEFGESEEEAFDIIRSMQEHFLDQGMSYFSQFNEFPKSITTITMGEIVNKAKKLEELGAPASLRLALLIARTHKFLGDDRKAHEFAQWGLNNIGFAQGLNKEFEGIIRG